MFFFVQTTLFCINRLIYVYLCKQFGHLKITLKLFPQLIPRPQKSEVFDIILPYLGGFDRQGHFLLSSAYSQCNFQSNLHTEKRGKICNKT